MDPSTTCVTPAPVISCTSYFSTSYFKSWCCTVLSILMFRLLSWVTFTYIPAEESPNSKISTNPLPLCFLRFVYLYNILYPFYSFTACGWKHSLFMPKRAFSNKYWKVVFNICICSNSRFLAVIVAAYRSCAVRSAFAMDPPIHPGSLRLFFDRLLISRPTDRCHFAWRIFSLTLIIVGCVIIATASWHTTLVVWPREEERFYANLEAKQPITGNGTANQSNSDNRTVNQPIVGNRTVNQSKSGNRTVNQSIAGDGTMNQSATTCP